MLVACNGASFLLSEPYGTRRAVQLHFRHISIAEIMNVDPQSDLQLGYEVILEELRLRRVKSCLQTDGANAFMTMDAPP
tara:strand:+ start:48350 stop:48586 length:237 start_codon:yes stop_codon:yes gene_type:complete